MPMKLKQFIGSIITMLISGFIGMIAGMMADFMIDPNSVGISLSTQIVTITVFFMIWITALIAIWFTDSFKNEFK